MYDDERAALAELCGQLPTLRAEIANHPVEVRRSLDRMVAEALAGRPIGDLLAELLPVARERGFEPPPGIGPGRASEERFGCPDAVCDREARTAPAGPLPRCWLTGRFMVRRSG